MIGKLIPNPYSDGGHASRAAGLVRYITAPQNSHENEKCIYSNSLNFVSDTVEDQIAEMAALAHAPRRSSKDPIMHIVLALREGEIPTTEQVDEMVQITLKELGLEGHQCVYGLHDDTENAHVHLAINRVNPETERVIEVNKGFTKNAVQRVVARIEHEQGWIPSENAMYRVNEQGEVVLNNRSHKERVRGKARDTEIRTGEKSAQRIGIEALPGILKEARDWQQFHKLMAAAGMQYDPKGGGAVIHVQIGDEQQTIKASQASRQASLGNLEKRFGKFQPPAKEPGIKVREPEPLRPDAPQWSEYRKAKDEHYRAYKERKAILQQQIAKARQELRETQKRERREVFSGKWRGHGAELNLLRSVVAAKQAAQRAELEDWVKQQRKQHGIDPFPTYEKWLEQQGLVLEAHAWRYQERENVAVGKEHTPAIPRDIRAMTPVIDGDVVRYKKDNDLKFTDYGQKIVFDKTDRDSVLAGLQLSQQKWPGGFIVTGSDEYLQQCAKLAVEHNLKITNIDHLIAAERERVRQEKERAAMEARQAQRTHPAYEQFRLMHQGLGADSYKVQVRDPISDVGGSVGRGLGFPEQLSKDGKPIPLIPADKVIDTLLTTEKKVTGPEKWSPILRPVSATKTYILVDDLDAAKLKALKEAGFRPAYVQETSPGNMQATLVIPKIEDRKIANAVATEIKQALGGDAACNGADHTMRIPGFENAKEKHRGKGTDGREYPAVKVIEASGGICPKASQIARDLVKQQGIQQQRETRQERVSTSPRPVADLTGSEIGYVWDRLAEKHITKAIPGPWKSEHDWLMALALRQCGYSKDQVTDALIKLSPRFDRGTSDQSWHEKHERTAEKAFSTFGTSQLAKYEKYHAGWIKDRDSALVIRDRDIKRMEREKQIAVLRKESIPWDGNATNAKVVYIDNDRCFVRSNTGIHEIPHKIEYKDRPKVDDSVTIAREKDGQVSIKQAIVITRPMKKERSVVEL
ncbi:TraI/MobA(P) family conjugative relaxase [Candidatus Igneacidithiobacillus taiwanensis]|uniref:TraI/MobA(P) family conjugative relaxase n=1 Tax=Candidatus Igneacidithiobacillus taiwanensis TaxID=1945924 RepID=UPI002896FDA4|nr:TraI/MobA(P) family conjugative relaxase [Candidatus Igneacidithiobacillus taiwanensis]